MRLRVARSGGKGRAPVSLGMFVPYGYVWPLLATCVTVGATIASSLHADMMSTTMFGLLASAPALILFGRLATARTLHRAVTRSSEPLAVTELPEGVFIAGLIVERVKLVSSIELRTLLRSRYRLTLDLGDDSPEFTRPGDPPLALWDYAEKMPVGPSDGTAVANIYRQNHAVVLATSTQPVEAAYALRKNADAATTVVDDAAIAHGRLFVREGRDVASMDLSLLRRERSPGSGVIEFIFGKATRVLFARGDGDAVVAALREHLTWLREQDVAAEKEDSARRGSER